MKPSLRSGRGARLTVGLALLCAAMLSVGIGSAYAKGGTAKPPNNPAPFIIPPHPAVAPPVFSVNVAGIHQFDTTGFIQDVTVDPTLCPALPPAQAGGTAVVNGITITVPCNSIVQMPANTLSWANAVDKVSHPDLSLKDGGYPSFEATITGNIAGTRHIAGLVFLSQQSLNGGQGVITSIDYSTGRIHVGTGVGAPDQAVLEINDPDTAPAGSPPTGRFGRANSPDDRFSVDQANPTVHAGTGYPMCVPRTTADPTVAGNPDDPLCPQRNRPKPVNGTCRDFVQAGVNPLPASGNLSPPVAGATYCGHYVMNSVAARAPTDPDPRQQAPFEVGDNIIYSGTLFKVPAGGPDFLSVHTIEANVGIYTQPGSQPAYTAIGEFGVGSADPSATAINGAAQETQDRIFLEAETTDVVTPVDIYLVDINPQTGTETNRWVTPNAMTGENGGPQVLVNPNAALPNINVGGGISTQFIGAQPQRARLRATKAPTGLLTSPTRTLRVVQRSLCLPPLNLLPAGSTYPNPALEINKLDANGNDICLNSQTAANGLRAGQYQAPTFEFIFPENVSPGDAVVPNDFWDLGFLVNGEGPGTGILTPAPW
ncbi:MAG: hypothetical protein QOF00_1703 [Pseudonocardiales bacterium]|jgi:hypothetical protein|nr:hypothetical protein [Pseudonocardiales bacterium]